MPTLETLTINDFHGLIKTSSLRKARGYIRRIQNPARAGNTLTAQVRGTRLYDIEVDVQPAGIYAICTCPYNWGGHCKHVGAVLLKWVEEPEAFTTVKATSTTGDHPDYPIEVISIDPPPTHRPHEPPAWLSTSFAKRQQTDRQQLDQWLNELKLQDLRSMAKKRGWRVKGTKKADIVQQILPKITQSGDVLKTTLSLDEEHRQALRALVILGGQEGVQEAQLERVATSWGELTGYKQISTYTRHLWELGLALPKEVLYSLETDFIPRAIAQSLPPLLEDVLPTSPDLESDQPASDLQFADPYELVRTVSQLLLLLEQSSVPLRPPMPRPRLEAFYQGLVEWDYVPEEILKAQQEKKFQGYSDLTLTIPPPAYALPDQAIERLAPVAGGAARLDFIYSLLLSGGLLQPGSPVTVWPEAKEQFLRQTELAQWATLVRVYFGMEEWSELWEVLRNQDSRAPANELRLKRTWYTQYFKPEQLHHDLAHFRLLVLRVLASLPDGQWVKWEDLISVMRPIWPKFDHTVWQRYWYGAQKPSWFLTRGPVTTPLNEGDLQNWRLAQGTFIYTMLTGPLAWLGLVDLSFAGKTLAAFRCHALADLFWDRVETPPAPRHAAAQAPAKSSAGAVTTDEYKISVDPSAISAQAHSLLDRIARLEVTSPERFTYRLDPQATHESFESDATLAEIIKEWEELLPLAIPETIQTKLSEWWAAYGQVRIYENVTLIEFGDDYALAEMKAVTSLENYLVAEISPRLVLISKDALNLLTTELEKAGYTPKITDETD